MAPMSADADSPREVNGRDTAKLHERLDATIEEIGWRQARLIILKHIGTGAGGVHGTWRRKLDHATGPALLAELERYAYQNPALFHMHDGMGTTRNDVQ